MCIVKELYFCCFLIRASSYEPGYRDGSVSGMNFFVCLYGKFQPGYRD